MYPANHKTVFVLDHTPYFGISCENPIEFEFLRGRTNNFIPMLPISKTLWTSSVESAIEYCRIVWDLFPTGKLVAFTFLLCVGESFIAIPNFRSVFLPVILLPIF